MSRSAHAGTAVVMLALLVAAALAASIAERAPAAASFVVNGTGTARDARPGDGICRTTTGACTLRAAIHEANVLAGADSIQVPAGTYPISPPRSEPNDIATGDLDIRHGLTVNGAGSASTVITGGGRDRVFEVNSPAEAVTINDVAIRGGAHAQSGAGIMNSGAGSVTVARSLILSNRAAKFGGGVANEAGGTVRLVSGTRLSGNSAEEEGSAVANLSGGRVEITGGKVTSNSSTLGGAAISNLGISPNEGTVSLVQATVASNVAGFGGGISNAGDGQVSVDRSTISNNKSGGAGGGIANSGGGSVEIVGAKVLGNKADAGGGGVSNAGEGDLNVASSTISNNAAQDAGGGILSEAKGALTVTGSTLSGNSALDGGGIFTSGDQGAAVTDTKFTANTASQNGGGLSSNGTTGGVLTVERVTLTRNRSDADGGGMILEGGAAAVVDSDFVANSALSGGGLANHSGGTVDVTGARITQNTAQEQGGGLDTSADAIVSLNRSEVSGNKAAEGGGMTSNSDAAFTVENTTVSGNLATVHGGGVLVQDPVTLSNTTIARNSAPIGGGLHKLGDSRLFLGNTIVADNSGGNCGYEPGTLPIESAGGNLDSGTSCALIDPTDISGVDPLLGPLQSNGGRTRTHAPASTSLAIDLALPGACPATDQRGVARPQNAGCDIGAHEFEGAVPPPSCGERGTRIQPTTADTWVNQADPGANFGDDGALKVRSAASGNARALVNFALPALPSGCQVVAATLRLSTGAGTTERQLEAARLVSDWTENGVTWANQPSTTGDSATAPSASGTVQWAVVSQVRAMYSSGVNQGFGIKDASENDAVGAEQPFSSREAGTDPPQLAITFG